MIRTLMWKEYREHRAIWIAMAAFVVIIMVSLLYLLDPVGELPRHSDKQAWLFILMVISAGAYGLVAGAMMLAGERENGTQTFLDSLPGRRSLLWRTKFVTGLVLVLTHALFLTLVTVPLGAQSLPGHNFVGWSDSGHMTWADWYLLLAITEVCAYVWGLCSSAFSRSVLPAAIWGLAFSITTPVVLALLLAMMTGANGTASEFCGAAGAVLLTAIAPALSWWQFCKVDFSRQPAPKALPGDKSFSQGPVWPMIRSLWWLNWQQGRIAALVLIAAAATTTLVIYLVGSYVNTTHSLSIAMVWPVTTALLGVFAGTTTFFHEQSSGSFRFIGDQRLPLNYFWIAKIVFWFALAMLAAAAALASELFLAAILQVRRETPPVPLLMDWTLLHLLGTAVFLCIWVIVGFAIGQLMSLVVRKTAVALVLAVAVTAMVLVLWLPTLIMGGWGAWQLLVVPMLLLAASRLALRPWVSGRLGTRRPILALAGCGVLVIAWMAGSLALRAVEISDTRPFDVEAYLRELPTPEQNEAGRLLRRTAAAWKDRREHNATDLARLAELDKITTYTAPWPGHHKELETWLDEVFQEEWFVALGKLPELPPGMLDDPRMVRPFQCSSSDQGLTLVSRLLRSRSMQLQARGDHALALKPLLVLLAISRQERYFAGEFQWSRGEARERSVLESLGNWRAKLPAGETRLLREALTALHRHDAQLPPPGDRVKADYVIWAEQIANLESVVPVHGQDVSQWEMMGQAVALAQHVPWERERTRRILNRFFEAELQFAETPSGDPRREELLYGSRRQEVIDRAEIFAWLIPHRRGDQEQRLTRARIEFAQALYRAERGQWPTSIMDLVPDYLPGPLVDRRTGQAITLPVAETPPPRPAEVPQVPPGK